MQGLLQDLCKWKNGRVWSALRSIGNIMKEDQSLFCMKDTRSRTHYKKFKKEELKAQVDTLGNLKIRGERHIKGNQWCRFLKSFQLPKDCNARMIKVNFKEGILHVVVPKPMAKDHLSQQSNGDAHNGGLNETKEHSLAGVANNNVHVPETSKQGMKDVAKGLNKYRQFIINVVVGVIVVVGLGIYKLRI